jgi:hypothetical protein
MSPTMTELDWQAGVAVFRASLPRRGAKGRNNRLFLEALHHHPASAAEALRHIWNSGLLAAFRLHQRREQRGIVEHQLVGALTHAENIQEPPGLKRGHGFGADHAAVGAQ